ncbi:MAG: hypothetical protein PHP50_09590 [Lachnospiraceae bacterium]|nr:hypothetical protein [Lachnospiraceae bacterium]
MASAGRILIIPRGNYSASTTYGPLDLVFYSSTSWLCKQTCVGIAPSGENAAYWYKFSSIGLNNTLTGTDEGYALDSRQGPVLKALIDSATETVDGLSVEVTALAGSIDGLLGSNIAPEYDSTATYAVNDYCVYNNELYICIVEITAAESFDTAHWNHVFIMSEIDSKVNDIVQNVVDTKFNKVMDMSVGEYDETYAYALGDYCRYNGVFYKCTTAVTQAEAFDSAKWTATDSASEIKDLKENFETEIGKTNSSLNNGNLQFRIENGKLQYRYDSEVI